VLHGESLMDDISSVLGHDVFGPLQDSTITDDTTTLCTVGSFKGRKRSLKNTNSNATQFGFENRVFDLDIGQETEPRYCSLAQFDGNDIARKSFKRFNRNKSASLKKQLSNTSNQNNNLCKLTEDKSDENDENLFDDSNDEAIEATTKIESDSNLNTIKIQIQGSQLNLSETEYEVSRKTTVDYKGILVTDNDEKRDGRDNEKSHPRISFVVDPPSPKISSLSIRNNEYRRHSSHTPSNLAPREVDINRRHSGHNPNLLTLDSQHMRFLSCSPAASRRISCGSLFKVNL
jgi:diacylglycerol kinase (ATP)